MKILYFIDCLTSGGKERRLTELMKSLQTNSNIDFELVIMNEEIHYKEVLGLGINIHYIIRKTSKDLSVFKSLYDICLDMKPNIIHCWDSLTAIYSVPISKLLGIKLINGMVTDAPVKQNIYNKHWLRARITFPFSTKIIGNSIAGLKAYKAPESRSICIYNGFNFKRTNAILNEAIIRKQLNIKTKYVIGMVASDTKFKDYKTYLRAGQSLLDKRKDITFLAIGTNTDSNSFRVLIEKKNFEYFRLLGMKVGIESYINTMDICVLSTYTEGISNSILEYMALGKPVIATEGGGTNEIVADKKTGFLVKQSNPMELIEKIELLIKDSKLRTKMGLAGKTRIAESFSIGLMVDKYISIYFDSIKNNNSN